MLQVLHLGNAKTFSNVQKKAHLLKRVKDLSKISTKRQKRQNHKFEVLFSKW